MFGNTFKKIIAFSVIFAQFCASSAYAYSRLDYVSDLIVESIPSFPTNHDIRFKTRLAVPPSGKIVITPVSGHFLIPGGFDFEDVDFATAPASTTGPFTDRAVASSADASNDGISVVSGFNGSVVITLNSSEGLFAGEAAQFEFGTNATFGVPGVDEWLNPADPASYRIHIETFDASDVLIEEADAMIVVVAPVIGGPADTTDRTPPVIFESLPNGLLSGTTRAVAMSIRTDEFATCRMGYLPALDFDTATTTFPHMEKIVTASSTTYLFWGLNWYGLMQGTTYTLYVKCRDRQGNTNPDDYPLSFEIGLTSTTSGSTSNGTGTGGGVGNGTGSGSHAGGLGGQGDIIGGGNFLRLANVAISGTAYPNSKIGVLLDGKDKAYGLTDASGNFSAFVNSLERGTYTFGLYAVDENGTRSSIVAATVSLIAGTMNRVSGILFPPTIRAEKSSVLPGENFVFTGHAVPLSSIEIAVVDSSSEDETSGIFATSSANANGEWTASVKTKSLKVGAYTGRARSIFSPTETSGWSNKIPLGVGQKAATDFALRADLNNDGKVNLVDFSILLFSWGTSNATADINMNGKVDLPDFSIMIFYWTG